MQCLLFGGLGEGLGSGDDFGLEDAPVGEAVVGAGVVVRIGAPCRCR
jgi:hypothetical protein